MQQITWSKEDLQDSVNKRLAVLRANRLADKGLSFDQRLALADDRIAFEQKRVEAEARRNQQPADGQSSSVSPRQGITVMTSRTTSLPNNVFGGLFMSRVDDISMGSDGNGRRGDEPSDTDPASDSSGTPGALAAAKTDSKKGPGAKPVKIRPDLSNAVDSHATHIVLQPRPEKPFVPHAQRYNDAMGKLQVPKVTGSAGSKTATPGAGAGDPSQDIVDENLTEVPADRVRFRPASLYSLDEEVTGGLDMERRRLLEQTRRQSSDQWVVLDRATVLNCLAEHADGLTMVAVAFQLLGPSASPRDTRRLSALVKREEARKTVTSGGRGKPIVITEAGRQALQETDVKQANQMAVERRQKRIEAQQQRLLGDAQKVIDANLKKAAKAEKAQKKAGKTALVGQKSDVQQPEGSSVVQVRDGKVLKKPAKPAKKASGETPD